MATSVYVKPHPGDIIPDNRSIAPLATDTLPSTPVDISALGIDERVLGALNTITGGIEWVKSVLAEARYAMIKGISQLMSNPVGAFFTLAGAIVISITLGIVAEEMKKWKWLTDVISFITTLGQTIATVLSFMQIDTLITLIRLGGLFNEQWRAVLGKIYESLGSLSEELERGWGFISAFAETNRAILVSAYSLSGNAWVESQAAYAVGLSDFMRGISGNLHRYITDPQQIFVDLQKTIAENHVTEIDTVVSRIWAGIDFAKSWIVEKTEVLIGLSDTLDGIVKDMPEGFRTAIESWYSAYRNELANFRAAYYDPFISDWEKARSEIDSSFAAHDISIAHLQSIIDSPYDLLLTVLGQDVEEKKESIAKLRQLRDIVDLPQRIERVGITDSLARRSFDVYGPNDIIPPYIPVTLPNSAELKLPIGRLLIVGQSWYRGDY